MANKVVVDFSNFFGRSFSITKAIIMADKKLNPQIFEEGNEAKLADLKAQSLMTSMMKFSYDFKKLLSRFKDLDGVTIALDCKRNDIWRRNVSPLYKEHRNIAFDNKRAVMTEYEKLVDKFCDDIFRKLQERLINAFNKIESGVFDSRNVFNTEESIAFQVLCQSNMEADDLITLFVDVNKEDNNIIIISTDRDFMQLISPNVILYNPLSQNQIKNHKPLKVKPTIIFGDTKELPDVFEKRQEYLPLYGCVKENNHLSKYDISNQIFFRCTKVFNGDEGDGVRPIFSADEERGFQTYNLTDRRLIKLCESDDSFIFALKIAFDVDSSDKARTIGFHALAETLLATYCLDKKVKMDKETAVSALLYLSERIAQNFQLVVLLPKIIQNGFQQSNK